MRVRNIAAQVGIITHRIGLGILDSGVANVALTKPAAEPKEGILFQLSPIPVMLSMRMRNTTGEGEAASSAMRDSTGVS